MKNIPKLGRLSILASWVGIVLAAIPWLSGCGGGGGRGTVSAPGGVPQPANWTIVDLGTVGRTQAAATSINNQGQIAGLACNFPQALAVCDTFLASAGGATAHLLTPVGTFTATLGGDVGLNPTLQVWINNNGRIVGNGPNGPFITGANGIGSTSIGSTSDIVYGVNDSGQVVGTSNSGLFISGPNGSGRTLLGQVNYNNMLLNPLYAYGINNSGQVIGVVPQTFLVNGVQTTGTYIPFITGPNGVGGTIPSTAYPAVGASPFAINSSGQFVAYSSSPSIGYGNTTPAGYLTGANGSGITVIGGTTYYIPTALNTTGQVVGRNFLYSGGTLTNLLTLPAVVAAGWTDLQALSINDAGQIVGYGTTSTGSSHAFLIMPS